MHTISRHFNVPGRALAACCLLAAACAGPVQASPAVKDADIAVTNLLSQDVSIIRNLGNRQFALQAPDLASAPNPTAPSVGDFNHDDLTDLVIVDGSGQPTLSLFLGQGNAQFSARTGLNIGYDVGENPAVGDFNNDGNADLFINHWSGGSGSEVQVLLGNGAGGFTAGPMRTNVPGANAVAVGDFNKDGKLDGVVTNWTNATVTVLFGDGAGGFLPADVILPAGNRPQNVVVGDFNKDGNADIAFAHGLSTFLTVYLGQGNGTFGTGFDLPSDDGSGGSNTVQLADMNGDGYDDLASFQSNAIAVYLWDPQQNGFAAPVLSPIAPLSAKDDMAIADFDSDGIADVVVTDRQANQITVYFGDGPGHFGAVGVDVGVGTWPVGVVAANLHLKTIGLDLNPNTLNVKSKGNDITAYLSGDATLAADKIQVNSIKITRIEFPDTHTSIAVNISARISPTGLADYDSDGIADLMVKFSRADVITALAGHTGTAVFTIQGKTVSGAAFQGSDPVRIQ